MRLRRVFILSVLALVLPATAFGGVALASDTFAADGVTLSVTGMQPATLAGDGQVEITVSIAVDKSRAEGGISNVRVEGSGAHTAEPLASVSIGENATLRFTLNLTSAQLGIPVPLTARWDGPSAGIPFTVTIPSSAGEPQISFTRTIDKTTVEKGGSVSIVYQVLNNGSVDITNLVITDEGADPGMALAQSELKAGNSLSLPYSREVGADFTSTPKLSFLAGGMTYTATCPEKSVSLKVVELEAVLRMVSPGAVQSGNEVTLVCDLVNTGSVKFTDIVISESVLANKPFTAPSLDKGESMQFSRTVMVTQTSKFQYVITAKDDSGNAYSTKSNELEVLVAVGDGQYNIEIMASPDAIQLPEPGNVGFEISITNKGASPVANASITDQNGELLTTFETLPIGVSKFTYGMLIDQTTLFQFTLTVPDPQGQYTCYTEPLEIVVTEPAASPEQTETAAPLPTDMQDTETSGKPAAGSFGSIVVTMLVVGVLIAVTIVVLIVMIIIDKLKKNKR